MEKLPSISVTVPVCVFVTKTVAPINGLPLSSVTLPVMVCANKDADERNSAKRLSVKRNLFFESFLLKILIPYFIVNS